MRAASFTAPRSSVRRPREQECSDESSLAAIALMRRCALTNLTRFACDLAAYATLCVRGLVAVLRASSPRRRSRRRSRDLTSSTQTTDRLEEQAVHPLMDTIVVPHMIFIDFERRRN